jgi:hypothetical protein
MNDYKQCAGCIHRLKEKPNPCMSCEQPDPTNYEEDLTQFEVFNPDNYDKVLCPSCLKQTPKIKYCVYCGEEL